MKILETLNDYSHIPHHSDLNEPVWDTEKNCYIVFEDLFPESRGQIPWYFVLEANAQNFYLNPKVFINCYIDNAAPAGVEVYETPDLPVLKNWKFTVLTGHYCIYGEIYNDTKNRFIDGTVVRTSKIKSIDFENMIVITQNTTYKLAE